MSKQKLWPIQFKTQEDYLNARLAELVAQLSRAVDGWEKSQAEVVTLTERVNQQTQLISDLKGDYAVLWTAAGRALHAYNNVGATSFTLAGEMLNLEKARASTEVTRQDPAVDAHTTAKLNGTECPHCPDTTAQDDAGECDAHGSTVINGECDFCPPNRTSVWTKESTQERQPMVGHNCPELANSFAGTIEIGKSCKYCGWVASNDRNKDG